MARSRRATVRRASVFFGFSFLWTAAINVLPQAYLLRVAPERKGLLLAGLLLIGTLSAWLGVELSRRRHARGLQLTPTSLLAATLVHALALLAVVAASAPLWAYCAAFVVFRGASNWLFNLGDGALVRAAGPDVQTHASASTGFQVLGNMTGPVAFALLAERTPLALALTVVVVAWTSATLADALRAGEPPAPPTRPREADEAGPALSRTGRLFLLHCLLIWTGIIGVFAQLIYLVSDWLSLAAPAQIGGAMITGIGLTALATIVASSRGRGERAPRRGLLVAALLSAAAVTVLATRPSPAGLVAVVILAGIGGGRFMLLSRSIASAWSGPVGRDGMLGRFNNLSNAASLVTFAILAALAAGLGEGHAAYNPTMLGLFIVTFVIGAFVIVLIPPAGLRAATDGPTVAADNSKPCNNGLVDDA